MEGGWFEACYVILGVRLIEIVLIFCPGWQQIDLMLVCFGENLV